MSNEITTTPLAQIQKIIHDNKLVDAAEIGDLERLAKVFREGFETTCEECDESFHVELPPSERRQFETLEKIISWLK